MVLSAQTTYAADVELDDFSISLSDTSIDVGDPFDIDITFEGPDKTDTISLTLEIKVDDVTVFLDEDYDVSLTEDADKTVTIKSTSFPGPDLDHDYFNDNLMNYVCDEVEVEVTVSGSEIDKEYSASADLSIGDDADEFDSVKISPSDIEVDEDITVRVKDKDGDEFEGVNVKVTWIDDPDGDRDGEWDSDDALWDDETDNDGEVEFNLEDDFDEDVGGEFQVDVYSDGYCLERKTIETTGRTLALTLSPTVIQSGGSTSACVKDAAGAPVASAGVYIRGTGYSRTLYTGTNGCVSVTIIGTGQYQLTASRTGYTTSPESSLIVEIKSTTTTTTTTIATTTTTEPTTTTTTSTTTSTTTTSTSTTTTKPVTSTTKPVLPTKSDDGGLLLILGGVIILLVIIVAAVLILKKCRPKKCDKAGDSLLGKK